jgi:hypothetical protein
MRKWRKTIQVRTWAAYRHERAVSYYYIPNGAIEHEEPAALMASLVFLAPDAHNLIIVPHLTRKLLTSRLIFAFTTYTSLAFPRLRLDRV